MRTKSALRQTVLAVSMAVGLAVTSTPAQAFACANCATEWTQLFNNFELLAQTAKQAKQLETQIKQWSADLINLAKLPQNMIDQALGPYREQLNQYRQLHRSVSALRSSANNARTTLKRRLDEMRRLNLGSKDYFKAEFELAKERAGLYREQLDNDLAVLEAAQKRAREFETLQRSIGTIQGNVEGFQTLAQYSHAVAGELGEIRTLMLNAQAQANAQNVERLEDAAERAEALNAYSELLEAKRKRQAEFSESHQVALPELVK